MSTRIMAIDTATEACSVAIWNDGQVYSHFEVCPREHTQRILPMVEGVLAEAGLTLEELDALAFGQGPGSFTGVRIGVGIAQGLALGANLPTIGISTLQAMAQGAHRLGGATHVLSAIDARMGEIYWGAYLLDESLGWITVRDEQVILPEKAMEQMASLEGEWYSVGTGWQTYPAMMQSPSIHIYDGNVQLPTALDMLPLALIRWANGEASTVAEAQPVYLRNEVSWQKLPGR